MVRRRILSQRRDRSQRDAQNRRKQESRDHQLQGGAHTQTDQIGYRSTSREAGTQISFGKSDQPLQIPHGRRAVETELMTQSVQFFLGKLYLALLHATAEDSRGRIARCPLEESKHDDGYPQQGRDHREAAANEKFLHGFQSSGREPSVNDYSTTSQRCHQVPMGLLLLGLIGPVCKRLLFTCSGIVFKIGITATSSQTYSCNWSYSKRSAS